MVTFSMASIPSRRAALEQVIESIRPQADRITVYLNGYEDVPAFLKIDGLEVFRSQENGDQGDAGKFFRADEVEGYHFTVDDDIIYPPDYAERLIEKIDTSARKVAVGVHGVLLNRQVNFYHRDRWVAPFTSSLGADLPVHILGTGTLAYHTDTLDVSLKHFKTRNSADIWFALVAQLQHVPLIAVRRREAWLRQIPLDPGSPQIYNMCLRGDLSPTDIIRGYREWKLYDGS